jgi:hypothetical protein
MAQRLQRLTPAKFATLFLITDFIDTKFVRRPGLGLFRPRLTKAAELAIWRPAWIDGRAIENVQ